VAENLVRYRIKDSSGKIFLADQTKALVPPNANPHTFGPFAQIITLPQALANQNGTLEIFSDNLGATEEINKIMIPLKFR
jgi:hypothetical protein